MVFREKIGKFEITLKEVKKYICSKILSLKIESTSLRLRA